MATTTKTSRGVRVEVDLMRRYTRAINWAKFHGEAITFDAPLARAMEAEVARIVGRHGVIPDQADGETSGSPSAPSVSPKP